MSSEFNSLESESNSFEQLDAVDQKLGRDSTTGKLLPGCPGGPGRPKLRPFRDALRKRIKERPEEFEQILDQIWEGAKGKHRNRFGETVSAREMAEFIRDTNEGRPTQAVEVSGPEDEDGLPTEIVLRVIDSKCNE